MSEWRIVYTEGAAANLRGIYEYIAYDLLEPDIAKQQVERIMKAINELDHMPLRYPLYKHEPWRSRGLRWLPIDNYLVFYHPHDESSTVRIIRIMYGGQDVRTELNKT